MKVETRGEDECWPWLAGHNRHGYGTFRGEANEQLAHRYGYRLHFGPIPEGMYVCHTCDNPECQNPRHWFLGTHRDNMADMVEKGRGPRPPRVRPIIVPRPVHKITDAQVRELRERYARGETQAGLGHEYGMTQSAIGAIVRGEKRQTAGGPTSPRNTMRRVRGMQHHNARLSPEQIAAIRSEYGAGGVSQALLASRYGVSQVTISRVVLGQTGGPLTRP